MNKLYFLSLLLVVTNLYSYDYKKLEEISLLFSEDGTPLKTEIESKVDDFGDEIVTENHVFMVDNQKFYVVIDCRDPIFFNPPFNIFTKFPEELKVSNISYNNKQVQIVNTQFKLSNGEKGKNRSPFGHYWSGFLQLPSNSIYTNYNRTLNNMTNGEISYVIPKMNGDNYLIKFNPFHKSWWKLFENKCQDWGKFPT